MASPTAKNSPTATITVTATSTYTPTATPTIIPTETSLPATSTPSPTIVPLPFPQSSINNNVNNEKKKPADSPETPSIPPSACNPVSSFLDEFDNYNTSLWYLADGWTNGNPFWAGWRADHASFTGSNLILTLDDQPCAGDPNQCSGQPYASSEYRTNNFYQYGSVKARLKAAQGDGIVTSLFTYTGPVDGNPHDEIDMEILGKDTTQIQTNYYANNIGGHETVVNLGFDAAQDFHIYSFEWSPDKIQWLVDGAVVHTETGGPFPNTAGRIMVNLWPGTGVDSWLKPFRYPGTPFDAYYDWIGYNSLECK